MLKVNINENMYIKNCLSLFNRYNYKDCKRRNLIVVLNLNLN